MSDLQKSIYQKKIMLTNAYLKIKDVLTEEENKYLESIKQDIARLEKEQIEMIDKTLQLDTKP
jgi:hypothetical protein